MVDIVIKNGLRYKTYVEKNGYIRTRKLCFLEKCNNNASPVFCKKHITPKDFIICKNCTKLITIKDSSDLLCNSCSIKNLRKCDNFTTKCVIENGIRYRIYKNAGKRKMCCIDSCPRVSSGEYCKKHKDFVTNCGEKRCNRCFNVKKILDFDHDNVNCNTCMVYKRESSIIRHSNRRKFIIQLKINMGGVCTDCGTNDIELLEFDHITCDKISEIRKMTNYSDIITEAEKTQLRCCNCHTIKTSKERKPHIYDNITRFQQNSLNKRLLAREYVNNIKITSGGCSICGWFNKTHLSVLQFDHINPKFKKNIISRMVSRGDKTKKIQLEIDKCRILCGNCHRKHTLVQYGSEIPQIIQELIT